MSQRDDTPVVERPQPVVERPVRSPCVSICALNAEDVCEGCFRTGGEISRWGTMSNSERRVVLASCTERARQMGRLW